MIDTLTLSCYECLAKRMKTCVTYTKTYMYLYIYI